MLDYNTLTYDEFIAQIINTRGQWNIPDGAYFEAHHIVPKCLGGSGKERSKDSNIIWLFPYEHLIAHYLLWRENKDDYKLSYAFSCMMSGINDCIESVLSNPDLYNTLKLAAYEANCIKNKHLAKTTPAAERKRRAIIGGNGNKLRLQNSLAHDDFVNKCKQRHANMSIEEKEKIYTKSSASLKKYYEQNKNSEKLQQKRLANIETNKRVSKQWRDEFKAIFNCTPESYRKYNLLQESLNLFKQIRYLDTEQQQKAVLEFNNKLEEIV